MKTIKLAIVLIALIHLACAGVYFSGLIAVARQLGKAPSFLALLLPLFLVFCSTGLAAYFAHHKRRLLAAVMGILPVLALAGSALYQHPEWMIKAAFPLTLFVVLVLFNLDVFGMKTKLGKAWGAAQKDGAHIKALDTVTRLLAIVPTIATLIAVGTFMLFSWQISKERNNAMIEIQKALQGMSQQVVEESDRYRHDD